MKVSAYVLLTAAMLIGYIMPIKVGVAVAGAVGSITPLFPDVVWFWPTIFGILAAIGALTPAVIAKHNGWLDL